MIKFEKVYVRFIIETSYGSVVELCVSRNKNANLLNIIKDLQKSQADVLEKDSIFVSIQTLIGVVHFIKV